MWQLWHMIVSYAAYSMLLDYSLWGLSAGAGAGRALKAIRRKLRMLLLDRHGAVRDPA